MLVSLWKKPPSPDLIEQFGRSAGTASIPHLAPALSWSHKASTRSALAVIDRELRKLRPADLRSLDKEVRRDRYYLYNPWGQWVPELKSRRVRKIVAGFGYPLAAAAMMSMRRSGYVREEAVRELAQLRNGDELPFLLLRASDWVEPVRNAALHAVEERLIPAYLPFFVRNLAIVDGGKGIAGGSALGERVESLLNSMDTTACFNEVLMHPDRVVRRTAARWALRSRADALALFDKALRQDDVVAAELIAREALDRMMQSSVAAGGSDEELDGLLQQLEQHPQGSLRRMALVARLDHFSESTSEVLALALFDRHAGVRDVARSEASKRGLDVAERYRAALSADPYIALVGLGESGGAGDAVLALPYLEWPGPKIRRAAVAAISRLAGDRHREALLDALVDESPGVSRAAARALGNIGAPSADLRAVLASTPHEHVRENVVRLLARGERWTALEAGLSALVESRRDVSEAGERLIETCLERWNKSGTQPGPGTIERLLPLWLEARPKLPTSQANEIDFTLRSFHRGPASSTSER